MALGGYGSLQSAQWWHGVSPRTAAFLPWILPSGAASVKLRRTYTRHGLNALMVRVSLKGLKAIDRRTAAARAVLDFRRELLDDLGGDAAVSAAQLALVEVATRTRLYLDHVDATLMERESLIVRRNRLLPLVEQRGRLASSLIEVLSKLGLERRQRPAPSLEDYVRERYGQDGSQRLDDPPLEQDGSRADRDHDPRTDGAGAAAPEPHV